MAIEAMAFACFLCCFALLYSETHIWELSHLAIQTLQT